MKLSSKKITELAIHIYEETIKKLEEIDNVEPGDTLRLNYEVHLTTSIDKQDVI